MFFNDADFPASDQISISGYGDQTFGSAGSVYLFSRFQFGLRIDHTLGSLTDQGDIRITTANEPPDAIREWGLAGYLGGIGAFHNGEGNIMMDLSSRVEGSRTGITAKHDGEGDLSIIVGSAIPAAPDGTIKATATDRPITPSMSPTAARDASP
jgi:hypothetical protein